MITEQDLRQAIAECQGERNPNANTCIKLAAYYTILDNIKDKPDFSGGYSGDYSQPQVGYQSDTEFGKIIAGKTPDEIWPVMDELMSTLQVMHQRLYNSVMQRLKG